MPRRNRRPRPSRAPVQPRPAALPRAALLAAALPLAVLPLASGCQGTPSPAAAATGFPHDAPTLLAAGAGHLEGTSSFRLALRVAMPADGGRAAHRMAMSGVWDARRPAGRMDGTLKGAPATVLVIGDSEYVSLPAPVRKSTGRSWMRAAPGTRTFAGFSDVRLVAMALRTGQGLRVSGAPGATWHVQGAVDRAAVTRANPDPALRAFAGLLPPKTRFDLVTDDRGRPVRIRLAPSGDAKKVQGTVELSDVGVRPDVREPLAGQILTSPGPAVR
ncbi:hypothetical protein GCM10023085_30850 [Actinomadura viridis]|uniref:Lipoprotein n=1 Tax=Actinomadura viridis TaxID=58110 RepID=A0A931DHD4_9ACTN|nr:hypothetical protein [Actinomadura viridis]MBG6086768.1 hypothetical protein [Actinomadura viridis]